MVSVREHIKVVALCALTVILSSCGGPSQNLEAIKLIQSLSENPKSALVVDSSNDNGRNVFNYGESILGGSTRMVWYNKDKWWIEAKEPKIKSASLASEIATISDNGFAKRLQINSGPLQGNFLIENSNEISIQSREFYLSN